MVKTLALALTVLTGFSGLVYEVAWQKYAATLLGSHSEATAAVLALFLGGLSMGYALFGRVTRRVVDRAAAARKPPRLLLLYGIVEAGIGVLALSFPWLFAAVRALSWAIPHEVSGPGFAMDVVLVGLLILPPTVLMGGTIPVLTQALARGLADATRTHALVYGFNTAGAFAGALLGGFVLVPQLGLERVVLAMGLVNLAAGASFGALGLVRTGVVRAPEPVTGGPVRLGVFAVVSLLAGFAAMALQTVLIRLGGLAMGSSEFTFSMVVAVFVWCIAVGSFGVSALPRIPRSLLLGVQCALAALLALLYFAMADAPYWAYMVRNAFSNEVVAFYLYHAALFLGILGVLAIPVGLSGATLPLIFHHLRREFGGLGSAAGRLYAWNTLGALLGALLGGYLLLFWLNLDRIFALALAAVIVSAGLLAIRLLERRRAAALAVLPALLALGLLPPWDVERLASGLFRRREVMPKAYAGPDAFFDSYYARSSVLFYTDDPASTASVMERRTPDGAVADIGIYVNGKSDGSIKVDYTTMALAALLPALFADQLERAFVIGYGTGVTVGEFAALEATRKVTVAEISPGVIEAAPYFESHNLAALSNPKTEVILSDAFRALLRSEDTWDAIVSEPSNPWVTGIEMLYSREFLTAARDRLRPGGVYVQWFHVYETDDEVVSLVMRTYDVVFDHVAVWYAAGDLILLGFEEGSHPLDLERAERRAAQPDIAAGLRRAGIDSFPALLAHELLPLDVLRAADLEGDIHTLLYPVLSHRAARAFFAGRWGVVPRAPQPAAASVGRENSLLARFRRRQGGRLSDAEHEALVTEACKAKWGPCLTLIASWELDVPESDASEQLLTRLGSREAFSGVSAAESLSVLKLLLGGVPPAEGGRLSLAEVRWRSQLYTNHYHHGTPFDRSVLADFWRRCKDASFGTECSTSQVMFERQIGPLRQPPALREEG
jgi:predicted membrane-bound spermidine synthase